MKEKLDNNASQFDHKVGWDQKYSLENDIDIYWGCERLFISLLVIKLISIFNIRCVYAYL